MATPHNSCLLYTSESAGVEITKIEDSSEFSDAVSEVVEKYKNQDPLIKAFVEMVEAME